MSELKFLCFANIPQPPSMAWEEAQGRIMLGLSGFLDAQHQHLDIAPDDDDKMDKIHNVLEALDIDW